MKKYIAVFSLLALSIACGTNEPKEAQTDSTHAMQHDSTAAAVTPDYSQLTFASKIDTICGMPIKAGVLDTAMVDGNIYGFCAKECKDEFVKTLVSRK